MLASFKTYIRAHKIVSSAVLVVLAGSGYWWYSSANVATTLTKYVVEAASEGTVIASVSATGQVQAGTTINITPKVSEEVTSIPAKVGQHVNAGQVLLQLDPTNEVRALASAKLALQQAELQLQESQQVSTTTLIQDQNSLTSAQQNLVTASSSLITDYQKGSNALGPTFVDFQTVMTGLQKFVQGNDLSPTQNDPDAFLGLMPSYLQPGVSPYKNSLESAFTVADSAYQQNLIDYHALSASSGQANLDALFAETLNTAQTVSDAVKAAKDFLNYVVNTYPAASSSTKPLPVITTTLQSNFSSYTNTIADDVTNTQGTITSIANDRTSIVNARNSLAQASETLSELVAGPTRTTLLGQQISVTSAQNNLTTAQQNLDYTSVRAPIAGVVSAISATVGTTAGASAITMVGDGEVAQVTLNEVDAAKVQLGNKATLTFDALPDLTLAGTVVEIDPVGTVSQGVVSYNVQVGFSQPSNTSSSMQVRPGMSVTADIVTQVHQNVIAVPNAAVTTSGGASYVLEPATPMTGAELASSTNGGVAIATKRVPVTIGIANDTMTEIASGVSVGDQIVVQTVRSSSASTAKSTGSSGNALQLLGGSGTRVGSGRAAP